MKMILLLGLLFLMSSARAASGPDYTGKLGVGIELGEQNGGTVKYWLSRDQAISAGLGITADDSDLGAHAEYVWTGWTLLPQPPRGALSADVAAGFRVKDDEFGIRTTAGLGYWLPDNPIETFFDVGPIFRLSPDQGVDWTAQIGVRFYFTPGGKG